ncbi:Uncharacterised protein [Mycobacteroides abscessus]|nr:Uncharacterised protein [Mycobacteroides abscessus]
MQKSPDASVSPDSSSAGSSDGVVSSSADVLVSSAGVVSESVLASSPEPPQAARPSTRRALVARAVVVLVIVSRVRMTTMVSHGRASRALKAPKWGPLPMWPSPRGEVPAGAGQRAQPARKYSVTARDDDVRAAVSIRRPTRSIARDSSPVSRVPVASASSAIIVR